eukprot:7292648-Pyramimonas_sp.AAC.1
MYRSQFSPVCNVLGEAIGLRVLLEGASCAEHVQQVRPHHKPCKLWLRGGSVEIGGAHERVHGGVSAGLEVLIHRKAIVVAAKKYVHQLAHLHDALRERVHTQNEDTSVV